MRALDKAKTAIFCLTVLIAAAFLIIICHTPVVTLHISQPPYHSASPIEASAPKLLRPLSFFYRNPIENFDHYLHANSDGKNITIDRITLINSEKQLNDDLHFELHINDISIPDNLVITLDLEVKYRTITAAKILLFILFFWAITFTCKNFIPRASKTLFILLIVIITYFFTINCSGPQSYKVSPDSDTYLKYSYTNPWASPRSPGYPAFVDVISYITTGHTFKYDAAALHGDQKKNDQEKVLNAVTTAQYVLMIASLTFLGYATFSFISPAYASLCIISAVLLCGIPDANDILTEPLSFSITAFFAGTGILFFANKTKATLLASSILAITGFLVKPGLIFLAILAATFIIIYALNDWRTNSTKCYAAAILLFLCCGIVAFPYQLYTHSGIATVGQLSSVTRAMFATYVATDNDLQQVDKTTNELLQSFFSFKPLADAKCEAYFPNSRHTYSAVYQYVYTVNTYGFFALGKSLASIYPDRYRDPIFTFSTLSKFANAILPLHQMDLLKLRIESFLSALGFVPDYQPSVLFSNYPQRAQVYFLFLTILLYIVTIKFTPTACVISTLLYSIHILNIAAMSYGHAVLARYTLVTEWLWPLGFIISTASLVTAICQKIRPSANFNK